MINHTLVSELIILNTVTVSVIGFITFFVLVALFSLLALALT